MEETLYDNVSRYDGILPLKTIGAHTHTCIYKVSTYTYTGICMKRRYKQQTKIEIKRNGERGWEKIRKKKANTKCNSDGGNEKKLHIHKCACVCVCVCDAFSNVHMYFCVCVCVYIMKKYFIKNQVCVDFHMKNNNRDINRPRKC